MLDPPPGRLRTYSKAQLLIIGERGYLALDRERPNLLFQVTSARYEKGSIIITPNKSIVDGGEYLSDPVLASALPDRLRRELSRTASSSFLCHQH